MLFDESNASSPASINIDDLIYESEFEQYVRILEAEMKSEISKETGDESQLTATEPEVLKKRSQRFE